MLVAGVLGFLSLIVLFVLICGSVVRQTSRNALARKEEVERLLVMASEEAAMAEMESTVVYASVPTLGRYQCAVCYCPTTTRCSRCKVVRYCSGKCQINHWRQGHKDECLPQINTMYFDDGSFSTGEMQKQRDHYGYNSEIEGKSYLPFEASLLLNENDTHKLPKDSRRIHIDYISSAMSSFSGLSPSTDRSDISFNKYQGSVNRERSEGLFIDSGDTNQTTFPYPDSHHGDNSVNIRSCSSKLNKMKSHYGDKEFHSQSNSVANDRTNDLLHLKSKEVRSMLIRATGENLSPIIGGHAGPSSKDEKKGMLNGLSVRSDGGPILQKSSCNGLKTSVHKDVQQIKTTKKIKPEILGIGSEVAEKYNYKALFPYELFVKLYFCDQLELYPFGLVNCGNSCYANAVLQCLAFTRPFTSYLLRGFHSKKCQKEDWCFMCEFEHLILKGREGISPLSPNRILSQIHKIGSHLGHGKEEDAHEFLRYIVNTMQSACLKEVQFVGPFADETTLVGLTFGGYLRSKIKCLKCQGKSEHFERMMDLSVEIGGNIRTLEEALEQFTATEILDEKNKYECKRCKSYQKAKKKLSVSEAPNILTIVLKRFKSGDYGKLNKPVRYPEVLNMAQYMTESTDKSNLYSLYAVIVHLDFENAAFSGHYVCYIRNLHGKWFKIDDSTVTPVKSEKVLSERAYILLYARQSPKPPTLLNNSIVSHEEKHKRRNLEAVPTSSSKSKTKSSKPNTGIEQKPGNSRYQIVHNTPTSNQLYDIENWRLHSMQKFKITDSSSESSSLFSFSDVASCSTSSTKDSDFSDYLFSEAGPSWYNNSPYSHSLDKNSSRPFVIDSTSPSINLDEDIEMDATIQNKYQKRISKKGK